MRVSKNEIILPVIGIPGWDWKKKVNQYAQKNKDIVSLPCKELCYECSRHLKLLAMFDSNDKKYEKSEYYKYKESTNREHEDILKAIEKFNDLYTSIRFNGCKYPPVVTEDGCRIDGSHRLAILKHMKSGDVDVNIVYYEDLFDIKTSDEIREQVAKYRREEYGL